jgi:hypothetical protein
MPALADHARRLLPSGLTSLASVACAACYLIPILLAGGVLAGAGWPQPVRGCLAPPAPWRPSPVPPGGVRRAAATALAAQARLCLRHPMIMVGGHVRIPCLK